MPAAPPGAGALLTERAACPLPQAHSVSGACELCALLRALDSGAAYALPPPWRQLLGLGLAGFVLFS